MKSLSTVLLIMLSALFISRECSRPAPKPTPAPDTITTVEYVYDTVPRTDTIPKPYPVEVIVNAPPPNVDTAEIIAAYYTKQIYQRTLLDDTTALIRLTDTVYNNELFSGVLYYQIRSPTKTITTNIINLPEPKITLHAGLFASGSRYNFGTGAALFLKSKTGNLYGIAYDPLNRSAQLHISWQILKFR